jgi:hypothetical protein
MTATKSTAYSTQISDRNRYLRRLIRCFDLAEGTVLPYDDLDRRVFAETDPNHTYLRVLIVGLRARGWEIKNVRKLGYVEISRPNV